MRRAFSARRPGRIGTPMILASAACLALSACVPLAVGAGGVAGYTALQERPIREAATDAGIYAQVNDALYQHDHELFGRVGVSVHEGRVLLTGVVPTAEDRADAGRLARQANGAREIINELQVGGRADAIQWSRDAWITTQLRTRLSTDLDISAINYSIETVNGVVYLIGVAQDEAELRRVLNHARRIPNVRKVVSHVLLKTDPRRETV